MCMPLLFSERALSPKGCFGMETQRDYRKFAEECRRLAGKAGNEQHRAILEQMAEVWLRLAEEAQEKGLGQPD
jgi:hypothetical protein